MSHSENFIGHAGVQEVFDAIWCGEKHYKVNLISERREMRNSVYLKGNKFDRMPLNVTTSFGQASTAILYEFSFPHLPIHFHFHLEQKINEIY
jgi:hypothetical protein